MVEVIVVVDVTDVVAGVLPAVILHQHTIRNVRSIEAAGRVGNNDGLGLQVRRVQKVPT
jgi:hypothetical protein